MFKRYLFILLAFAAFILQSIEATPKVVSPKNKKSTKPKKEKKNTIESNQSP